MEFNRTTEDLNFLKKHVLGLENDFNSPSLAFFKIIKDKNGFFTKYERIEQKDAIAEKENVVATLKLHSNEKNTRFIIVKTISIPNKQKFKIIMTPDGRIIDSRKIKLKECEILNIYKSLKKIIMSIDKANTCKSIESIEIVID